MKEINDFTKEELLEFVQDLAKRWLAHDGLWFQAVEKKYGLEAAIEMDTRAWERFTVVEANRIKNTLGLPERAGLEGLEQALKFRFYAFLNKQTLERVSPNKLIYKMVDCRVQSARERKGMDFFPCKPVGLVEYSGFAKTIDDRISTKCIACPPDQKQDGFYCGWEFTLAE